MNRYLIDNDTLRINLNSGTGEMNYSTRESSYDQGIYCIQKGKYTEAARHFRNAVALSEDNAEAHYHLAYSCQMLGQNEQAIEEYRVALKINPGKIDALINSGIILSNLEKYKESEKCYNLVLKLSPGNKDAYLNLGNLNFRLKEYYKAIKYYQKALRDNSEDKSVYFSLGNCFYEIADYENAVDNFNSTFLFDPQHQGAINNLGLVFYKLQEFDKSLRYFNKALELNPENALTYFNIANVYRSLGKNDIALIYYKQAIDKDPALRMSYVYIADILSGCGKEEEAWHYYNLATGDKASKAFSFTNLGLDMMGQLKFKEALKYFDVALTADENIPEVHYNKAHIYLLQGNFDRGWEEYEWRLRRGDNKQPEYDKPYLSNGNITGKKILVTDEQGLGDALQFIRYLSILKQKGAYIIFECRKQLLPLIQDLLEVDQFVEKKTGEVPAVEYDYHIPLMSLPYYFKTNKASIPNSVPYISPAKEKIEYWGQKIRNKTKLNVGLVWAGNPSHTNDKNRSCTFETLAPIFSVKGVDFYSLQIGTAGEQLNENDNNVINIAKEINSLEDTAAIISNLDLVISVDTSVAHLAGALGKPVMVLLPFLPDWRWMLDRDDSAWYPTMKLFRKSRANDWNPVISEIKKALTDIANKRESQISEMGKAKINSHSETLYLSLSTGGNYGWGVCSNYLRKELSKRLNVINVNENEELIKSGTVNGTVLHTLNNNDFSGLHNVWGKKNIGYTFFENELSESAVRNSANYDLILGGSSWNEQKLRERGIKNTGVLIQGIDPELFYPEPKRSTNDLFIIFSGGKFELRKGQDLVLRAIKILQQKYSDIILINAWHNAWPKTMQPMAISRHIRYQCQGENWKSIMSNLYKINGIDGNKIMTFPLIANNKLRELYSITDIGVFPNRCEGGTNLAMMEYMACGKPVIASYNTGHKDILTRENSIMLETMNDFKLYDTENKMIADWKEPDFDEFLYKIEFAYMNRDRLSAIGRNAAETMKKHTWSRVADNLIKIIS